jgi:hypothetical protein
MNIYCGGTALESTVEKQCMHITDQYAVSLALQHLTNLLAAPVQEVVASALQTFQVLLRKTHHTSVRWAAPPGLSQRLLCLSKGWGGKDEVRHCAAALHAVAGQRQCRCCRHLQEQSSKGI